MKKCPKCGKMNFSNTSFCSDCGDNLEFVHADNDSLPSQHFGMHWFFAWLIMQGSGWLGGLLINSILEGILSNMSISDLRSSLPAITNIAMILQILLTYVVIFIWIRLTFKRYFYAGPWNFFTYLWFVSTPFLMMIEFGNALSGINMSMVLPWIITILGILTGIIGFTVYKKKLEDQL